MINLIEIKTATTYRKESTAWFHKKTDPRFGLSNMAGGYKIHWPLERTPATEWSASEQLYQFAKYGSDVQCLPKSDPGADPFVRNRIRAHKDARGSKMTQKCAEGAGLVRPDWEQNDVRIKAMLWVLELKLYWNPLSFGKLLADTGTLPIVEISDKDDFWGVFQQPNGDLVGMNVLGKLLTDLRSRSLQVKRKQFTYPDGFLLP